MAKAKQKFDDVMIDLETLGTRAGCQILSVGAAFFGRLEKGTGAEFYGLCRTRDDHQRLEYSLEELDPRTLAWWGGQSEAARDVLRRSAMKSCPTLESTLVSLAQFLHAEAADFRALRVWGNGADFDQPILAAAYAACGVELPWRYVNSRCFRTWKSEHASVAPPRRAGTHHDALDDARHQARHAQLIFRSLAAPRRAV